MRAALQQSGSRLPQPRTAGVPCGLKTRPSSCTGSFHCLSPCGHCPQHAACPPQPHQAIYMPLALLAGPARERSAVVCHNFAQPAQGVLRRAARRPCPCGGCGRRGQCAAGSPCLRAGWHICKPVQQQGAVWGWGQAPGFRLPAMASPSSRSCAVPACSAECWVACRAA